MLFEDRYDAGSQLGQALMPYQRENPVVIALPRGGVVVGYEVAKALTAPLDVIIVRKLGVPSQPELGFGAVAPGEVCVLNREIIRHTNLADEEIRQVVKYELAEVKRRLKAYRQSPEPPDVSDRCVILVDDGLATGVTARAGIAFLKKNGARKIILAVPVAAPEAVYELQQRVDDLICLETPTHFNSVSLWYRNFEQTTDTEVIHLLSAARQEIDTGRR